MYKKFLVFAFLLLLPAMSKAQEVYDLTRAITTAIQNNPSVTTIQNNISLQELNLKTAYGNLIPSLSFSGSWSQNNTSSVGGTVYQNGIPIFIGDQSRTSTNVGLGLSSQVTLFNGLSNYESVTLEKQNLASQRISLDKIKYDIVINVYQKFFDVLKRQKIVEANAENLKISTDQLEKIKEYVNVGKKTLADVYKQDVLVAQNELTLEQSKNDLDKSKVDLLYSMTEDVNKMIVIEVKDIQFASTLAELNKIVAKNSDVDGLTKSAVELRYDYKIALQDITVNETKLSIAKKNLWYPTLSLFGNYNVSGTILKDVNDNRVLNFGLNLNYPLFQGFKSYASEQVAQINIKQKKEDLVKLELDLKTYIKKAVYDLQTAYKQIEILERNIKSAEQDKILSEENFRIGYGTLLDVQVATTNLNSLFISRINALYNFFLAEKQIQYLSGILKY